jgi:dihydrodipicolinate synthase/N-acetylneuraminate lyase
MAKSASHRLAQGVYAALATPRRPDSTEIDTAALLDYLDTVVQKGVDGLVLFGATGEFIHYDVEERQHAFNMAVRRSRVPVLVNVSHSTLDGAIALAENAIGAGAAGLLLMPPYFYKYTDDEIQHFYVKFAGALEESVPIYLYNIPAFTNPISPGLAAQLLSDERFAGIKDSSGSWEMFESLKKLRESRRFQLLVGNETIYLRAMVEGADGVISGLAAAFPELIVAIDRAVKATQFDRARRLNDSLKAFLGWISKFPASLGIKEAAVARGWPTDHMAIPLPPDDVQLLDEFAEWVKQWMPAVLRECEPEQKRAKGI